MSDDRPKFVGVFHGASVAHGPSVVKGGSEISCSFAGTAVWAVDDRGSLYNLSEDYRGYWNGEAKGRPRVWVQVHAAIVRNPNEAGE